MRSTSRNGYRWGRIARMAAISITDFSPAFSPARSMAVLRIPSIKFLRHLVSQINRLLVIQDDPERRVISLIQHDLVPGFIRHGLVCVAVCVIILVSYLLL